MRSKSWRVIIRGQQREINKLLLENPSLKSFLPEAIADGFAIALDLVMLETSLEAEDLPASCPYTFEQAINYQL